MFGQGGVGKWTLHQPRSHYTNLRILYTTQAQRLSLFVVSISILLTKAAGQTSSYILNATQASDLYGPKLIL